MIDGAAKSYIRCNNGAVQHTNLTQVNTATIIASYIRLGRAINHDSDAESSTHNFAAASKIELYICDASPEPTMTAALPHHIEAASPHVMNTYGRLPIALSHGQGCHVWDVNGKRYLDALGGIAVNTLGHNHAKLVPALQHQLSQLIHCSNYYHVPLQETLAAKLVELSGLENVFFCSTGLERSEERRVGKEC